MQKLLPFPVITSFTVHQQTVKKKKMSKLTRQINKELAHEIVEKIDNFLFDCEGVLWDASQVIRGAPEALQKLKSMGKRIFYVTNNSSKTRAQIVEKCKKLGFPAEEENIVCPAHATAQYLKSMNFDGKVYMIGNPSMAAEMDALGIKYVGVGADHVPDDHSVLDDIVKFQSNWKPDPEVNCVVVGFDPHHSYMKMLKAATYAKNKNNLFLATNEDSILPTNDEICVPCAGCIVSSVKMPAQREPHVIGKPETAFFDILHDLHHLKAESSLMVGDRCISKSMDPMYVIFTDAKGGGGYHIQRVHRFGYTLNYNLGTDIHMAVKCDIKSILVLSGANSLGQVEANQRSEDPVQRKIVPDYYIDSFGHFGQLISDF